MKRPLLQLLGRYRCWRSKYALNEEARERAPRGAQDVHYSREFRKEAPCAGSAASASAHTLSGIEIRDEVRVVGRCAQPSVAGSMNNERDAR